MTLSITQENFTQEIQQETKPVILEAYAIWCGPCQQMAPILEDLENEMGSTYKFAKLNVDEARDLAIKYGIISVPTFLFINKGTVKGKETGYMSKETLREKIKSALE